MYPLSAPHFDFDVQRYSVLLGVADAVSLRHRSSQLFFELIPQLCRVVPFDLVSFSRFDASRKITKIYVSEGGEWPRESLEIAVDDTTAESVWRKQSVLSIEDLSMEGEFKPELQWLRDREMRSYCVVPLTTFHQKLGTLGFASKQLHPFREPDIRFLHRVAEIMALSLDTTLAEAAVAEEVDRLRLLIDIERSAAESSDFHESVALILGSLKKWAVQDIVGLYTYDEASESLRLLMPDQDWAEKMAPQGLTPLEGTLAGQAFRSRAA
jgi:GAF domain-containing protein